MINTFEKELLAEGIDALKPLERADTKEGVADPDEVSQVVMNRSGSILSASTILKSDFFPNLQKMALPECVIQQYGHWQLTRILSQSQANRGIAQLPTNTLDPASVV